MLLTKTEALLSWCPMTRIGRITTGKCLADGCAAWRWSPVTNPDNGARRSIVANNLLATKHEDAGTGPEGWEFIPASVKPYAGWEEDSHAQWIEPQEEANQRRRGYCGLAGNPDL